ncbi:hypothetical protein GCM10020331_030490 [Ectobacillus funiculus]
MEQCPLPYAEMHPELAARNNLANGDKVKLTTRRGHMTVDVRLTKKQFARIPFFYSISLGKRVICEPINKPCFRSIFTHAGIQSVRSENREGVRRIIL